VSARREAAPGFAERVRASFARQRAMATLGARLVRVEAGAVEVELPWREELTQQGGVLHAGVLAAILDSACGYAALTLMPADSEVVSVEFKLNLLAPARGERIVARAGVKKAGRTLSVCDGEAFAITGTDEKLVASMTGTMMRVAAANPLEGAGPRTE
jgi:uncharacterized protein (TIGR00369 family)